MNHFVPWAIALGTVVCVMVRPWRLNEALWATCGALLLIGLRIITPNVAWRSIAGGTDVYLFLAGMMLLAEIARAECVFDWTAATALRAARGSRARLFALVFAAGVVVTVFLSNDATAIVLTPAVLATAKRAKLPPLPYAFSCAFVANAASFVLPISNPANLVVYGGRMPALGPWLAAYALPSVAAIVATFVLLRWYVRRDMRDGIAVEPSGEMRLRKRALSALALSALAILAAALVGLPLGAVTAGAALVALAITSSGSKGAAAAAFGRIDYPILLLVAGLFVIVGALDGNGALAGLQQALATAASAGEPGARIGTAFGTALLSNVFNNLPVGVAARFALGTSQGHHMLGPVLIGIDLGPNLSITGSLATLLWMSALRAEGTEVTARRFLRAGLVVMPAALLAAVLCLR